MSMKFYLVGNMIALVKWVPLFFLLSIYFDQNLSNNIYFPRFNAIPFQNNE